jgi:transposase
VTVTTIEREVPLLSAAREIIDNFHVMIRTRAVARLDPWIKTASDSLVTSFARGITKDRDAVHAAITEPWSNGQTEGQVNRLKFVKRQMYGRAKIRPARSKADRRDVIGNTIRFASDPILDAD